MFRLLYSKSEIDLNRNTFCTNVFLQFFFCNGRLFLGHHDFLVNRQKNCSNFKTDEQEKLCFKKLVFPQKMHLEARIAVVTTRKMISQIRVFWKKFQGSVNDYIYFKKKIPQKLPRIGRLRVPQIYRIFSLKLKNLSETEKNEVFSFENIFQ